MGPLASLPDEIAAPGLVWKADASLADHTSMGVGGPADWLAVAEDEAALMALVAGLRERDVRWMVLGGGSNTIFSDAGFRGVVVKLGRGLRGVEAVEGEPSLIAGAGASLSAVMNFAKRQAWTGLEWAAGVPGQLGGALAGNAGAGGGEICPLTERVWILDESIRLVTLERSEFTYSYRRSSLMGSLILRAQLTLTPGDPAAIEAAHEAALAKRWEQPVGKRCSGCMFKNPEGDYAGRLIDAAGLKGLGVGQMHVSAEHANFMINEGGASADELLALLERVRSDVRERFGIELESEIRVIPAE